MKRQYFEQNQEPTQKRIKIDTPSLKRKNVFDDNIIHSKKIKLDMDEIYVRWKRDIIIYL